MSESTYKTLSRTADIKTLSRTADNKALSRTADNMSNVNKKLIDYHRDSDKEQFKKNNQQDNDIFQRENDYLIARNIAVSLHKKSFLTDDEFEQIDALLRQRFSPKFSALIADNPCYV